MSENKTVDFDELRKIKIFIATSSVNGQISDGFFKSMVKTLFFLNYHKIPVDIVTVPMDGSLSRTKNTFVTAFLNSNCTHLVFIDSNIEFKPDDLLRLLVANKEIVCGTCPKKGINWEKLRRFLTNNMSCTNLEFLSAATDCDLVLKFNDDNKQLVIEDGLLQVEYTNSAFMCIRRDVLEKMIIDYQELEYEVPYENNSSKQPVKMYTLFDSILLIDEKKYLNEDYSFCERWKNSGGKIYLDPNILIKLQNCIGLQSTPSISYFN